MNTDSGEHMRKTFLLLLAITACTEPHVKMMDQIDPRENQRDEYGTPVNEWTEPEPTPAPQPVKQKKKAKKSKRKMA